MAEPRPRILIIDDDPHLGDTFRLAWERDLDIECAYDPESGLKKLRSAIYDVAMVDLVFKVKDGSGRIEDLELGAALCRRIKKDWPLVRVVIGSGYVTPSRIIEIMATAQADYCFEKGVGAAVETLRPKLLELARMARRDRLDQEARMRPGLTENSEKALKSDLRKALQETKGNVSKAAEILPISRRSIYTYVKRFGIVLQKFRTPK